MSTIFSSKSDNLRICTEEKILRISQLFFDELPTIFIKNALEFLTFITQIFPFYICQKAPNICLNFQLPYLTFQKKKKKNLVKPQLIKTRNSLQFAWLADANLQHFSDIFAIIFICLVLSVHFMVFYSINLFCFSDKQSLHSIVGYIRSNYWH